MAVTDRGTLRTKITDTLNRTDIANATVDEWINTAMRKVERGWVNPMTNTYESLEWRHLLTVTSKTNISGDKVAVPVRYKSVVSIYAKPSSQTNWNLEVLKRSTLRNILEKFTDVTQTRPSHYGYVPATAEFYIRPKPDENYDYEITGYVDSAAFTADTDTNWWITNAYEILLYGALIESAPFLRDYSSLPLWRELYNENIIALKASQESEELSGESHVVDNPELLKDVVNTRKSDFYVV